MRCRQCSEVRGYPYKRSHLVALRTTKITAAIHLHRLGPSVLTTVLAEPGLQWVLRGCVRMQ
jgi:hypothetical protein